MLACSFFCYQISLAIDTSIITLKKIFSRFFILVLNSLISKGYLYESGWPNLEFVPEHERFIPELENNEDNAEV